MAQRARRRGGIRYLRHADIRGGIRYLRRVSMLGRVWCLRRVGMRGGIRYWRHAGILGGCLWVTRCSHHVIVIPITPLPLTTALDITGHIGVGRVAKLSSGDRARAGLALSAGGRRR